jgi:hypothetical protein
LGISYHNNASAWMTGEIFAKWLLDFDKQMRQQDCKVLLLVDNFSGHKVPKNLKNTKVEFFEPNLTPHVQPMDAGIIRTLKALHKRSMLERSLDREEAGFDEIFQIDQLEAMQLLLVAWEAIKVDSIAHCWRHTQILPNIRYASQSHLVTLLI